MQDDKKNLYEMRKKRFDDAVALKEPDRVPFIPITTNFLALHFGITIQQAMTDARSIIEPARKYCEAYDPDAVWQPGSFPIKAMELIGDKQARWPGDYYNLPENTPFQYVDHSYISEDDWEEYLRDPSYYILRKVIPERYEGLKGLGMINPYAMTGHVVLSYMQFANPLVQEALQTLIQIANTTAEYTKGMGELFQSIIENGYPVLGGATASCPFDDFADHMRGLMELCADLVTIPEIVDEALDKWAEITIPAAVAQAKRSADKETMIFLHCGMDNFMSLKNYEKHYWPQLKKLITALIDIGKNPIVFCEGKYNTRLDCITDVPKGKVLYAFEDVDWAEVKRVVGPYAAICGGMSTQLLMNGTPEKVVDETKRILDTLAPGGGFVMSNTIALDIAPPKNMEAWRKAIDL